MVDPIRVFAGVVLPSEVRLALADRIARLSIPGRVAPPENWHLTVRFLGSIDQITYERFLAGLKEVEDESPFRISLDRFGAFPSVKRATVVWIGLNRGESELRRLNEIAEEAAIGAGITPEERPYSPHLTLSRVRPPVDVRWIAAEQVHLSWECGRLVVFRSNLGAGPARYEPLESFRLNG